MDTKQVTADYFFLNNSKFTITNVEKSFAKFCVKIGNTVNFSMSLTSDDGKNLTIYLKKNGIIVATAPISATI